MFGIRVCLSLHEKSTKSYLLFSVILLSKRRKITAVNRDILNKVASDEKCSNQWFWFIYTSPFHQ